MSAAAEGGAPILTIRHVSVRFGGIVAVDDVSFDVPRGAICGLIGPNGAGKTTLFNCISGLYRPERGSILFERVSLLDEPVHAMAGLGIARTFQNLALFGGMTVRDNILVGGHCRARGGFAANGLALPFVHRQERRLREHAETLIEALDLSAVADSPVAALTFATRKRVELARALASEPRLLLLDEPAGGLNHEEVDRLRELIVALRRRFDLTILLVEHHMGLVTRVSDLVVVLNFGRLIAQGPPGEIQGDPRVVSAYLGAAA